MKKRNYTNEIIFLLEGITDAIKDEIAAQEFYLNLIERAEKTIPEITPILRKIRYDELKHFNKLNNIRKKVEFLL